MPTKNHEHAGSIWSEKPTDRHAVRATTRATDLFDPAQQPPQGLGVFVLPAALHESLDLQLLDDDGQVWVRP